MKLSLGQRLARLPEPSRIRETNNTYSRIRYRLGIFLVPDLVLEPLNNLHPVSVLDLVLFKVCLESRFWIWYRLRFSSVPVLDLVPMFSETKSETESKTESKSKSKSKSGTKSTKVVS